MNALYTHLCWGLGSLLGIGCYAIALAGKGRARWFRNVFYQAAFSTNLVWFILPFTAQPRMAESINLQTANGWQNPWQDLWIASVWLLRSSGVVLLAWALVANLKAMRQNAASVHGDVAKPAFLLQSDRYQRVRHPMNAGGMILVLGLSLVSEARVSTLCWPIYMLIAESFSTLEERLVLRPHFGSAYTAYAKITPRTFTRRQAAWLWSIYFFNLMVEIAAL